MKKSILIVSLMVAALLLVGASAQAYVLFDAVPTSGGYGSFSGLYQGFNWTTDSGSPLLVVSQAAYNADYGNHVTFPDIGGNAASNNQANTVTLTAGNGGLFTFNGAEFWSWTMAPFGATTPDQGPIARGAATGGVSAYYVDIMGWVNGVAVYNAEMNPTDFWNVLTGFGGVPTAYAIGGLPWTVDKVTFSLDSSVAASNAGTYWLMDCVDVKAGAVPLPPSFYLLGAGLIGAFAARRRTK
jgi:hypothetical protein